MLGIISETPVLIQDRSFSADGSWFYSSPALSGRR